MHANHFFLVHDLQLIRLSLSIKSALKYFLHDKIKIYPNALVAKARTIHIFGVTIYIAERNI